MVRAKKAKKPLPKALRVVKRIFQTAGLIVLAAVILFLIFFGKVLFRTLYKGFDTGYKTVDVRMTTEQKIKDLDYMYDLVCLQNPKKEVFEQAYGISYDDVYKKYRKIIEETKSEYEFLSYMSCFLAELPGEHNLMWLPDYKNSCANMGYAMNDIYGTQKMKDYTYSWMEYFRDDVKKYADYKPLEFNYVGGKYIAYDKYNEKYAGGTILTLNGRDPKEMCFDFFERFAPTYDGINKCYYRYYLFFNDRSGVKYTAEILMADGTTVTAELYADPGYTIAFCDGPKAYPEADAKPAENKSSQDVMADDYVPTTYKIATDKAKKLVYLESIECNTLEGRQRLVRDLQNALDEVNAETVIVDLRRNPGGSSNYAYDILLPLLFSHDVDFSPRIVGKLNKHTKQYDSAINRILFTSDWKITKKDGYYYFNEKASVKGKATRNYKIYVLTSTDTFSTADIVTAICKRYDNAVIVGTNTGGEGIGGNPINCILPESNFGFIYVPTVNVDYPEDGIKGIEPDIWSGRTVEEYRMAESLAKQGKDPSSYEVRQIWDGTLNKVLKMISGQ